MEEGAEGPKKWGKGFKSFQKGHPYYPPACKYRKKAIFDPPKPKPTWGRSRWSVWRRKKRREAAGKLEKLQKRPNFRLVRRKKPVPNTKETETVARLTGHNGKQITLRKKGEEAIDLFYKQLQMPEFKEALEMAPDPRYQMLLKAMMSPKLAKLSFSCLARRCQITTKELTELWRDHQLLSGTLRMLHHLPDVMEDIAIDSKTVERPCPDCNGTGRTPNAPIDKVGLCLTCRGDGHLREIGDAKARDLLFEAAGIKKGGPLVSANFNINSSAPSYEETLKDMGDAFDLSKSEFQEIKPDETVNIGDKGGIEGSGQTASADSGPSGTPSPVAGNSELSSKG